MWDGPDAALTMVHADEEGVKRLEPHEYSDPALQHWSVRTKKWRYILYNNGSEELYDHDTDPYEWTNLSEDSCYWKVKSDLKARLYSMTGRTQD